jgi:DNA polymerase III delta prime subunit
MLFGYDKLIKTFKTLAEKDRLSHGYIFFGEPQVGKATFAKSLANFMEFGEFKETESIFTETFLIQPDLKGGEDSIGIDTVREIKRFLYAKPVNSEKRMVIIDEAWSLTPQAQNAILKIAEEPPKAGLLVIIVSNPDSLLATLQSRFQKVYFPRLSTNAVKEFLVEELKLSSKEASEIAKLSFGKIGRAKNMAVDKNLEAIEREVAKFLKGGAYRKDLLKRLVEPDNKIELRTFLEELTASLSRDSDKNYLTLKAVLKRLGAMSQFNVNKRLQLEAGLIWTT